MHDNCNDCPMEPRVIALEEANRQHGERIGKLETETAVQNTQLKNMDGKLDDIKADNKSILTKVEALEAKPGKKWDGLAEKAVWAVCAAVIAFLLAKVGL